MLKVCGKLQEGLTLSLNIQAADAENNVSPSKNGEFKKSSDALLNCIIKSLSENKAEDGIRDHAQSRGLGDVYKRQIYSRQVPSESLCTM